MAVRSAVLARWVSVGGLTQITLIPNDETWLVKSVFISNRSGGVAQVAVTSHNLFLQVASILYYGTAIPAAFEPTIASLWAVSQPGDQLEIYSGQSGVTIAVYGARLAGVAGATATGRVSVLAHPEVLGAVP